MKRIFTIILDTKDELCEEELDLTSFVAGLHADINEHYYVEEVRYEGVIDNE